MAALDIMPLVAPYGGICKQVSYPMNAAADFSEGEPVIVEAAGTIIEASTLPTPATATGALALVGIAAARARRVTQLGTGVEQLPGTNTRLLAPVWLMTSDVEWISNNLMTSVETITVPLLSHIGDRVGLALSAATGRWGPVAGAAATTLWFVITRVLDAQKRDIRLSGQTGVWTVFQRAEKLQE